MLNMVNYLFKDNEDILYLVGFEKIGDHFYLKYIPEEMIMLSPSPWDENDKIIPVDKSRAVNDLKVSQLFTSNKKIHFQYNSLIGSYVHLLE